MPNIPNSEQETTINLFRDDETAKVYTSDSTMITKLDKMVAKQPDAYKVVKQDEYGKWYEFPKKLLRFGSVREYTDEQREQMHQRLISAQNNP